MRLLKGFMTEKTRQINKRDNLKILCRKIVVPLLTTKSFLNFVSIFESGDITIHLMTAPSENSEFCFPRVSRKQLSVSLGPVTKCLIIPAVCLQDYLVWMGC